MNFKMLINNTGELTAIYKLTERKYIIYLSMPSKVLMLSCFFFHYSIYEREYNFLCKKSQQ